MVGASLIIEGSVIERILSDSADRERFLKAANRCQAVVCCRLTPKQKAQLVKLMKTQNPSQITAAIGDGANDIPMLQEAHVGIGIYGLEGMQAVQNSDFAIG